MAVQLAFNFIISRQSEINAKYPGGWQRFSAEWVTNPARCRGKADDHLVVFSSMGYDYSDVYEELERSQIAVAHGSAGPGPGVEIEPPVDWLETEPTNEGNICWLKGSEPGRTVWFITRSGIDGRDADGSASIPWWQFWRRRSRP